MNTTTAPEVVMTRNYLNEEKGYAMRELADEIQPAQHVTHQRIANPKQRFVGDVENAGQFDIENNFGCGTVVTGAPVDAEHNLKDRSEVYFDGIGFSHKDTDNMVEFDSYDYMDFTSEGVFVGN